jgi:hypothetical protein
MPWQARTMRLRLQLARPVLAGIAVLGGCGPATADRRRSLRGKVIEVLSGDSLLLEDAEGRKRAPAPVRHRRTGIAASLMPPSRGAGWSNCCRASASRSSSWAKTGWGA